MCGIVGYIGMRPACPILLKGLSRMEYQGYDSAGVALISGNMAQVIKTKGYLHNLREKLGNPMPGGYIGIGHIRWATHGHSSDKNAHPHSCCTKKFNIVHNGVIENYLYLKTWLEGEGHQFLSETDSEVLAHLVEHYYQGDLFEAFREALKRVNGSYAVALISTGDSGKLLCACQGSPLVIGLGDDENFIASDISALLDNTRRAYVLENGETAIVAADRVCVYDNKGSAVEKKVFEIRQDMVVPEKGEYPHFMLKEIMEQPHVIQKTLHGRILPESHEITLEELDFTPDELKRYRKLYLVACGTAYHAALIGKYVLEKLVRIPVEVDLASEYCYRDPLIDPQTLVIVISQSGETADTLAALRFSKQAGNTVLAITNVAGSSVAREAHKILYTWAGPEIAVASTKTYITQLIALYLLALKLGLLRGTISQDRFRIIINALRKLPSQVEQILEGRDAIREQAQQLACWENVFFVGRNLDYAVAMEGSLKLKEVSYIHAEAYAAGELKHGPLALIVEGIPIISVVTQKHIMDKTLSNIQEFKARGAFILAVALAGAGEVDSSADSVITVPDTIDILAPVLAVVPLQLLSYYVAVKRGCPVDKPRNLAKSVMVE